MTKRDPYGADAHRESIERTLAPLSATQHGVFTLEQAVRAGATRRQVGRRVATGRWERLSTRVYRFAGVPESWRQRLLAATLTCGSGSCASHRSAAALQNLPGFPEGLVEISAPRNAFAYPTHSSPLRRTASGGMEAARDGGAISRAGTPSRRSAGASCT